MHDLDLVVSEIPGKPKLLADCSAIVEAVDCIFSQRDRLVLNFVEKLSGMSEAGQVETKPVVRKCLSQVHCLPLRPADSKVGQELQEFNPFYRSRWFPLNRRDEFRSARLHVRHDPSPLWRIGLRHERPVPLPVRTQT